MPQTAPIGGFDIGDVGSDSVRATQELDVLGWDVVVPPGSPSAGDIYIVGVGATGPWYTWDNDFAAYVGGGVWRRTSVLYGQRAFDTTRGLWRRWDGRYWTDSAQLGVARAGLAASATQTQGQGPLGHALCVIATCATTNDVRTMPPATTGQRVTVANDGAETLQVFPASGDSIDAGAADASVTIASGKRRIFEAVGKRWISVLGA